MNEDRLKILAMLQESKITIDEATRLLDALDNRRLDQSPTAVPVVNTAPYRAPAASQPDNGGIKINLSRSFFNFLFSNLEGAITDQGWFEQAKILFSNLDHTNLRKADCRQAWVVATNLEKANLEGANLEGARIFCANLDHADFRGADLRDCLIFAANFEHADFRGVDLRGRVFLGVNMAGSKPEPTTVDVIPEG
jgi:uncharacterized protein YjbI with pentapeptide repeats